MSNLEMVPFTKDGLHVLQKELENLKKVERPKIISEIAEARGHGDLKENAEYHAAREKQGFVEARISELEDKISRAHVIEVPASSDSIGFGAWVTLQDEETGDEKTYRIVGDLEADIEKDKISLGSPIAKALLGKKIDDLVEIRVPKGTREFVVLNLRY